MPRTAAAGVGSHFRACARTARRCLGGSLRLVTGPLRLAALLALIGVASSAHCQAQPAVKGEAMFTSNGSYARLVLKLAEDVESDVVTAGTILVIRFKRPVDISVEKLAEG